MSFHYDYQTSEEATDLAKLYRNFLTLDTVLCASVKDSYLHEWASMFESLLKDYSKEIVLKVTKAYMNDVRKNDAFVHIKPESFKEAFPVLYKQYRRHHSPLPESEFAALTQEFLKCRLDCERDVLVATLGHSLQALRKFKKAVEESNLSITKKDYLETAFGSNFSYIRRHLLPAEPWYVDRVYHLPKPITYRSLRSEALDLLRVYGCGKQALKGLFLDVGGGD